MPITLLLAIPGYLDLSTALWKSLSQLYPLH